MDKSGRNLLARIDGKLKKRVIRVGTAEYNEIMKAGIGDIMVDELENLVSKHFLLPSP